MERYLILDLRIALTEDEYCEAQQGSKQQLFERALNAMVNGRKVEVDNALPWGPEDDEYWEKTTEGKRLCLNCGDMHFVMEKKQITADPVRQFEEICPGCGSNRITDADKYEIATQ